MIKKLRYFTWMLALLLAACGRETGAGTVRSESGAHVPEYVFTYADNQPEDYPTTRGAFYFAELVKEKTEGRIEIVVQHSGVMGDELSVLEQLRFGGIDFARMSLSILAEEDPHFNVLQLPYLYEDSAHMWRVLEGELGETFMGYADGLGVVGLSWYDAGARSFYTKNRPIENLGDMKGMRIRVIDSELMSRMIEALGGTPVPLLYDEVYSGLQTGIIDGAENNYQSYESMRHYEVAKYFTEDEHTRVPEMQLVSKVTWEKLSKADQEIIRDCAEASALYERELWAKRKEEAVRAVRAAGVDIITLSAAEKRRFREAVLPVYEEFCKDDMDLVEAIIEEGEEN